MAAAVIGILTGAAPAGAEDSLVASWRVDRGPASVDGSSLSVDWIRRSSGGVVVTAGADASSLGSSRWTIARLGGAFRPHSRLTVSGQASVGRGDTDGDSFEHRTARGDLAIRVTPAASITAGNEYIHVAGSRGHVVRVGVALRAAPSVLIDLSQAVSVGGNLKTSFTVGRVDLLTRPVSLFGGGAWGRTTPELVALTGVAAGSQDLRQVHVGIGVPIRRVTARVTFDSTTLAGVTRRALTLATTVPVGR